MQNFFFLSSRFCQHTIAGERVTRNERILTSHKNGKQSQTRSRNAFQIFSYFHTRFMTIRRKIKLKSDLQRRRVQAGSNFIDRISEMNFLFFYGRGCDKLEIWLIPPGGCYRCRTDIKACERNVDDKAKVRRRQGDKSETSDFKLSHLRRHKGIF